MLAFTLTETQWNAIVDLLTVVIIMLLGRVGIKVPVQRMFDRTSSHVEAIKHRFDAQDTQLQNIEDTTNRVAETTETIERRTP